MAALDGAIVHHRDARMQHVHDGTGVRSIAGSGMRGSMMCRQIKVHGPDQVPWAREAKFLQVRQVSQIDEPEFGESDQHADGLRILARIGRIIWLARAQRIRLARAG